MKNITDTLTPLMDKFRAKTGLTDKLTIARATNLMSNLEINNLIKDSSSEWALISSAWDYDFPRLAVKKGDSYTFTVEVKDNSKDITLAAVFWDDEGRALEPDNEGNAPVHTGNISAAYVTNGYHSKPGKMSLTVKVKPDNCKYLEFRIVSWSAGDFKYRNPIVFKENTVGGVTKLPLFAFLKGGARYAA